MLDTTTAARRLVNVCEISEKCLRTRVMNALRRCISGLLETSSGRPVL